MNMKTVFNKFYINTKYGFTLMEIMVVIIVIAVLASVAGPMIGSITDQGKTSATKANMGNVKTALVNFNNDLGKFPFVNTVYNGDTVDAANDACLGTTESNNVLVNNSVGGNYQNLGIAANTYARRWKGPYMDTNPEQFMMDSWSNKIMYFHEWRNIWLQSAGPDGIFDRPFNSNTSAKNAAASNYDGDDILTSVSKVKF